MGKIRKPFEGVWNIIRFNWHFYTISTIVLLLLLFFAGYTDSTWRVWFFLAGLFIVLPVCVSLIVSYYVYDLSGLYKMKWVSWQTEKKETQIVNVNAGFDETSILLKDIYPDAKLVVLDFYDPEKNTEISIKRARKAYPPFPGTRQVDINRLSLPDNSADKIFVIFAAHEIRSKEERIVFFKELKRILKPKGQIIVAEHLRDRVNFWAYNIGFLHFYSKENWLSVFRSAGLIIKQQQKYTPFISIFTISKYGITS